MDEEKELVRCYRCRGDRVIGFKLRSIWDGRIAYDVECADCGTNGSITEKKLVQLGWKFWKVYGEDKDWKCGGLPAPVDRWWDWWSVRDREMEWRSYEDGIVLIAYGGKDASLLYSLAKTLPKTACESLGEWELVDGNYKEEFADEPERCHTYLRFKRTVFP
jgi:hypothetical protein